MEWDTLINGSRPGTLIQAPVSIMLLFCHLQVSLCVANEMCSVEDKSMQASFQGLLRWGHHSMHEGPSCIQLNWQYCWTVNNSILMFYDLFQSNQKGFFQYLGNEAMIQIKKSMLFDRCLGTTLHCPCKCFKIDGMGWGRNLVCRLLALKPFCRLFVFMDHASSLDISSSWSYPSTLTRHYRAGVSKKTAAAIIILSQYLSHWTERTLKLRESDYSPMWNNDLPVRE